MYCYCAADDGIDSRLTDLHRKLRCTLRDKQLFWLWPDHRTPRAFTCTRKLALPQQSDVHSEPKWLLCSLKAREGFARGNLPGLGPVDPDRQGAWSSNQCDVKQEPAGVLDSLRGSSAKIGTIQRRLAWSLRKDDTH